MNEEEWKNRKKNKNLGKKEQFLGFCYQNDCSAFWTRVLMKKYEKLKLVIVFVLSVVLFSAGFTSFASTGKTHVNVKSKKQL